MGVIETIKETLVSGDPLVRTWFMVESNYMPFVCSFLYVLFVKRIGPSIMKNRKPFDLRRLMIVYNFAIVFTYTISMILAASAAWVLYVVKYVEFIDTIFFVLRKKFHLITNLHVIHHAALPVIAWVFIRTETSGFQFFPAGLNSVIHIIMYTYYGLAAMGPEMQKYLWWKEHLTKIQMWQFVIIIVFVIVIIPLSGCQTTQHGIYIEIFFAFVFLSLFYNFYVKTYKKKQPLKMKNEVQSKKTIVSNGKSKSLNDDCYHNEEELKGKSNTLNDDFYLNEEELIPPYFSFSKVKKR
ncbi:elongation of very long chain fatty acids protein 7 [Caerostris darwini]|uniref:Elongation of very long chain fatty acids protein n=1 Tax=Caerostris darwini TaxID=1538125 RepID=A0AAV4SP24_9ARAC|nr:elongation of very long chain fatty acids protein 7 [Caerostris darwini]